MNPTGTIFCREPTDPALLEIKAELLGNLDSPPMAQEIESNMKAE
jgi:hypothetical protein